MSWTVPSNCYYGRFYSKTNTIVYYNANASVPNVDAPENIVSSSSQDADNYGWFILVDFNNGYIYAPGLSRKTSATPLVVLDNSNKEFTVDVSNYNAFTPGLVVIGSQYSPYYVALFDLDGFSFGNGSNILDKFNHSDASYVMYYTFYGRTDITSVAFPNGVRRLDFCCEGCTSLATVSTIPSTVVTMQATFKGCTSLAGEIVINANTTMQGQAFYNTTQTIVLTGTSTVLNTLANTANNGNVYVWSLSATMTAQRDEVTTTDVDVSVTVTRFRGNNDTLSSLVLYNNGTAIVATWNDPTLTMTSATVTFTTTLSNINENSTFTLSVIATDAYGSSVEVSVNIPIALFTIDIQAGGKEIAFGTLADDNMSGYPNGLFKCNMDALFSNNAVITNPYFTLNTSASPGTTDGDLYAAIVALGWDSDVIV